MNLDYNFPDDALKAVQDFSEAEDKAYKAEQRALNLANEALAKNPPLPIGGRFSVGNREYRATRFYAKIVYGSFRIRVVGQHIKKNGDNGDTRNFRLGDIEQHE